MHNVLAKAEQVAKTDSTILLLGETGQVRTCWSILSTV